MVFHFFTIGGRVITKPFKPVGQNVRGENLGPLGGDITFPQSAISGFFGHTG
jgi:hypothetical protein